MSDRSLKREAALRALLIKHPRIAIVGGPRTGKTTLSTLVEDRTVIHTDDWISLPWGDVPGKIIERAQSIEEGTYVVEGVQTARALRRGLEVDAVLYLDYVYDASPTPLTKAVATVFRQWRDAHVTITVVSPDL